MNTAAAFILAILPVIQVVTKVPTTVAIARTRRDQQGHRKRVELHEGRHPVAAAVTPGPK